MAKAEINAGVCGFKTTVVAKKNGAGIDLQVESGCKSVLKLAEQLSTVDPYKEVFWRKSVPQTLQLASTCLSHPACPVPAGIIKAIEVEAGLALPRDVTITVSKSDE